MSVGNVAPLAEALKIYKIAYSISIKAGKKNRKRRVRDKLDIGRTEQEGQAVTRRPTRSGRVASINSGRERNKCADRAKANGLHRGGREKKLPPNIILRSE